MRALLERICKERQERILITKEKTGRWPRWQGPSRELIRGNACGYETPMLTRYRLFMSPFGQVFVHHWHRRDADLDCHDHPWRFGSFVLKGGYTEEIRHRGTDSHSSLRVRRRFSFRIMPLKSAHRVISLKPETWTLMFIGKKRKNWGFWVHNSPVQPGEPIYVDWRIYIASGGNPDPFNS